jgi:hypothetical protein
LIFAIEISYLNKCNTKNIIVFQIKKPHTFQHGVKQRENLDRILLL